MAIRFRPVGEINLHGKNLALSQSVRKLNFSSRKLEVEGRKSSVISRQAEVASNLAPHFSNLVSWTWLLEPCWMNLSGLMALSDVFSFWVDTIFQGSCNPQSLLHGEVDVLFDIPLIGLFKAVWLKYNSFHMYHILLWKIAVSRSESLVGSAKSKGARRRVKKRFLDTDYADGGACMLRFESWWFRLTIWILWLTTWNFFACWGGYLCNLSIKLTININ